MDYQTVLTTCAYCGCGCGLYLEVMNGRIVGVSPSAASPVNQGKLCIKGWHIHEAVNSDRRLTRPLIRRNGSLVETTWDEALRFTVERLQSVRRDYGPDKIAFMSSARATNEENYLFQKFARAGVGTNNVDHCARLCHASTVVGLSEAFGSGAMTNSIAELEDADCILVIGSNTTSSHPLVANRILRAKSKGARLIIADPRLIQLAMNADLHLRHNPGTDVALLNGIIHEILRQGRQNSEFIDQRTEGFSEFREALNDFSVEKAAEITGVPAKDIAAAAQWYAEAQKASIVYCMGITQHTTGVDNVKALANLAMLCGQVGRESTGVNPLRGQNNVQGACDMGALPNVLPGYQAVDRPELRGPFEQAWKTELPDTAGMTLPDMFAGLLDGEVKALYIMGENPMLSDPDTAHVEKALRAAGFLLVQDIFLSQTAELADVVLPGCSFAEKDGTFTNTERRVQLIRQAMEPLDQARPDWRIIQDISTGFGYPMHYGSPAEIMSEIALLTPIYRGISFDRLGTDGLQWPCPDENHPGTGVLHRKDSPGARACFIRCNTSRPWR